MLFGHSKNIIKELYNNSYFEAGRSPRKQSLHRVNEHFEGKPDAKRALLDNYLLASIAAQMRSKTSSIVPTPSIATYLPCFE